MRISDWSSDVCSSDLIDEDVAVVHRRDQADVLRQQHAVAENVAGHVADAHAGEVLLLAVTPERAEVALDRLPAAAGGDAHALVVVADRTAGGERVVEPVAVLAGDAVGDVRERSEEHTSELQSLMRI